MSELPSNRAGRSTGAMVLIFFGSAWLVGWTLLSWSTTARRAAAILSIGIVASALLVRALQVRSADRAALQSQSAHEFWRTARRPFHLINVAQWILIIAGVGVLASLRLSAWIVPMVILVVGAHFLPLARIFASRLYYLTGAAMIALAVSYPFLSKLGPGDPIGCLASGAILWMTALFMLRRRAGELTRGASPGDESSVGGR